MRTERKIHRLEMMQENYSRLNRETGVYNQDEEAIEWALELARKELKRSETMGAVLFCLGSMGMVLYCFSRMIIW